MYKIQINELINGKFSELPKWDVNIEIKKCLDEYIWEIYLKKDFFMLIITGLTFVWSWIEQIKNSQNELNGM